MASLGKVAFVCVSLVCGAWAFLPERFGSGVLNSVGRGRDPFGEDDVPLKLQLPIADSSKRSLPFFEPGFLTLWLDAGEPLDGRDFRRTATLSDEDLAPPPTSTALYSQQYFEGDIVEPLEGRNAVRDASALWPGARIPYVISRRFTERERTVVAASMQGYHDRTCIRFEPKNTSDYDFIYLYPGSGCASQVGRAGGMQYVSLGVGCLYVGIAQHELMHATGFWHEQSRADRDKYVQIRWDNIEPGMAYNFDKYTLSDIQHLDAPYDYGSVMHYGSHAFAKGFGPTIVPTAEGMPIGQRRGLSETDFSKINKLYGCPNLRSAPPSQELLPSY